MDLGPETDVIAQIENDEFYGAFLDNDSKPSPQVSSISEQVKKLGQGIDVITRELQKQVLEKHQDLLRQGNHATKLEDVLNIMNIHVQNLFANAERLRSQIAVPYNALETHTKVLSRLHLASHIMRQVNRIQQLSKRLSNTNDPVQKATILRELELLASDADLTDIDAVTSELRNVKGQQQKVVRLATGSLNQGIINENFAQTSTALQIFANLGTIETTLQTTIDNISSDCRESLKVAFEIAPLQTSAKAGKGPGRVSLTSSQGFRVKAWLEVEKIFSEDLYKNSKQIKFLQETLNDLNLVEVNNEIARQFWVKLGEILQEEVRGAPPAIQQMLDEDYPKLLKCLCDMHAKLKYAKFVFDRHVLIKSENVYLSTSLNKLLDTVQAMFGTKLEVASHDQIDSFIRVVSNELSVALVEEYLSEKVCKIVAKAVKMFALKTEQQIETGPEAVQVLAGAANLSQQRNVQHANALCYLQVQIQRMLFNMKDSVPKAGMVIVKESVEVLSGLIQSIIQPLVDSTNATIETIIITIHLETDWAKLQIPASKSSIACSPYMRELTQFITRVYNTYFTHFNAKEVLLTKCSDIAIRCIELLVRHASILRPLNQGGRLRLQSDFTHIEHCLRLIYPQLSDLGRPYRLLKSMESLVVLSPEELVASQACETSVPDSTVLLLLFSYAGVELASPHQNTAWSIPKFSNWLDQHVDERDRLDLIAGAVQKYENVVRQKNSVNYDAVYPVMSTFLASVVHSSK